MRAVALLTALAACGDLPGRGDRAVPLELDPRFGVTVDVPLPIFGTSVVGTAGKGGTDWVAVWYDAGFDDQLREVEQDFKIFRVDPEDGFSVEEMDPPELVDRDFFLWHAFQPDQALLSLAEPAVLFAYDGGGWVYLDPPSGLDHVNAAYVLFDKDRLFAWSGGSIAVWDGASWRAVPAPAGSTLGPIGRDRFRTVSAGPCTIAWDFATLAADPAVCATSGAEIFGWAVNGDVDDFHALDTQLRLNRFVDGAWATPSEPVGPGASLLTGDAAGRAVMAIPRDGLRVDELRGVTLGGADEVLFPAIDPTITCECDRATDPECPCANPDRALTQTVIAADGQSLDLFLALDVNGTRELHARRFDLPVTAIPFSPEDVP